MVQIDYCFMRDKPEEPLMTILTETDNVYKSKFASVCTQKGGNDWYIVKVLKRWGKSLGLPQLIWRSDPEISGKHVCDKVCDTEPVESTKNVRSMANLVRLMSPSINPLGNAARKVLMYIQTGAF